MIGRIVLAGVLFLAASAGVAEAKRKPKPKPPEVEEEIVAPVTADRPAPPRVVKLKPVPAPRAELSPAPQAQPPSAWRIRRESLEEAKTANRPDLMANNEAEIKVLEVFLPQAMPAEELRAIVQAAIAETGAAAPSDMGKVMKVVMPKVAGRAPNDMISAAVKELLAK